MPDLELNKRYWDGEYDWSEGGDEWSAAWGGPDMEWFGTLLPRVHRYLPVGSMLEIAPGFGRWTQYLKNSARKMYLVDISKTCIDNCKRRFRNESHIDYFQNDGKSLTMIPDHSIDMVFSFDSLVHVEVDVIESYLQQLADKLTPHGVGIIHHSNLGALKERPPSEQSHWRAQSVGGPTFLEICRQNGLCPISQEILNWGGPFLLDCITVFTPQGSRFLRDLRVFENPGFMEEVGRLKKLANLYSNMTCTNSHVVSKGNRLDDTTPLHSHSRVEASSSPKVSVIIPNYNHGRFLEKRIRSVLDQSFGDFEAIFLDDASTDDSREVFTKFAGDRRIRAIWNKQNSGGTFRQWNKGFREAKGEYVWVAESDDYADERFLEVMLSRFAQHPSVGLVCCRPMVVDDEDRIVGPFDVNSWWVRKHNRPLEDYFSKGRDECAQCMAISNTIPNASGVLMRRSVLEAAGYADESMSIAADYLLMAKILLISDIAFVAEPLNFWRSHSGTVRASQDRSGVTLAETYRVVKFIVDHVPVDSSTLCLSNDFWYDKWRKLSAESGGFSLTTNLRIFRAACAVDPRIGRRIARRLAGKVARKIGVWRG